jgi:uncharacterized protein
MYLKIEGVRLLFKTGKKKLVVLAAVMMVLLLLVVGCGGQAGGPKEGRTNFVFGSSVDGSYGYLVLEAISSVMNKHFDDIRFSSVSTDGGTENIMLLFNKDIDAGHSNNADILMAYSGEGPFSTPLEPMQLLSYGALTQIVAVRADSDINSIYDLEGRTVIVGPPGSGLETDMTLYCNFAGINIVPVNLAIPETGDAFIGGRADAALLLFRNGQPYPLNMEVESAMDIKYLPWDPEVNKKMMEKTGATPGVISPDVSPYMNEPYEVYMNPMIMIVHPDLEEDLAYSITKTIVENYEELMAITPHLRMVSPENVTKGLIGQFPVHPGAVKYYKEAGIWEDRLTAGK